MPHVLGGAPAGFCRQFLLRVIVLVASSAVLSACGGGGGGGSASANVTSGNTSPDISAISNQVIDEDGSTGPLAFTVSDAQTASGSLQVSASSSNQGLVTDVSLVLGGADADRTVTVTPVVNASGTTTITLRVSDGAAATTTAFAVTVVAKNDPPVAVADAFAVNENTGLNPLNVLGNDTDPDLPGDTLTITDVGATSAGGTVTVMGASLQYTPLPGFTGVETFTYTIQDSAGAPSTAMVTVSVNPVGGGNSPPTVSVIAPQVIDEDIPSAALGFSVSDAETPPGSLVITASSSNQALIPDANLTLAGTGANRTITLTPAPDQNGGPALITINVSDGIAITPMAFSVTVTPQNDAPTVTAIADQTIDEDTSSGSLGFTIGDVETPAGSLVVTATSSNQTIFPDANLVLGGSGANRSITVTPEPDVTSGPVTITVNVSDGTDTTPTTFTVTVTPQNDAPTITAIADQTIDEDTSTGPLGFSIDDIETPAASLVVTASSSDQTLIPDANLVLAGADTNRTIEVTPAADQSGTATITVVVSDGTDPATTTFSVSVNPTNDPPTAVADAFTVDQGTVDAPLDVLGNDLDADLPADTLTITAVGTTSAGGTVTNAGSQLLYTAAPGYTGTETFSYTIEDAALASSTATVTVNNVSIGLAHYWKLDEASSPYDDSVGSASATCVTCPTGTAGLIGSAQDFDGVDDAVSVDSIGSLNWDANQSFSIEFWVNKNTPCAGEESVIGRADTQTQLKWWVGCDAAGKAVFELFDENGAGQALTANTGLDDGNWHHVVAIRDAGAGENRLYVDGALDASVSIVYPDGFTSQSAVLSIGWLDDSAVDYDFSGIVDEVAIHTGVLSDADIAQHYGDGSIGLRRGYLACTGPVRIMPLGNSNTQRKGYRPPLWFTLAGSSYDVDFVGGRADSCPNDPSECVHDPDHEGHSGFTPSQIASNLNTYLTASPPDVVLLHIGTNDLDTVGVQDILNAMDSFDPAITVVLARIINRKTFHQPTTDFNIAVAAMAQQRINSGDKILIVDMESALIYPDDMEDELHPLQVGYDKMAGVWANGLTTFLPVCP